LKLGHWLGLLVLAAAAVVLWNLRQNLILLFSAVVLAMALCTVVDWVRQKLRCGRPLALVLSFLLVLLVLGVIATAVPANSRAFGVGAATGRTTKAVGAVSAPAGISSRS
jgi:predicted PurR-regulated permease PerM